MPRSRPQTPQTKPWISQHAWNVALQGWEHGYQDANGNLTLSHNRTDFALYLSRHLGIQFDKAAQLRDRVLQSVAAGAGVAGTGPVFNRTHMYDSAFLDSGYRTRLYLTIHDVQTGEERTVQHSIDTRDYPTMRRIRELAQHFVDDEFQGGGSDTKGNPEHQHVIAEIIVRSLERKR